jgi:hypothetical protein
MAARHWQWRRRNAPLAVTRFIIFIKRVTGSGAFHYFYETHHCQWRVCFLYIQNVQRLSISLVRGLESQNGRMDYTLQYI